ncbi:MAG: dolichyl-phosphate-mannose--protein mannosyltransferase [Aquificae bacterium]|nr:dolichyl-phosphate-mannose--protein mannosyltransferase [Aquificota bacterium]
MSINLNSYNLRGEEAKRLIPAFEMVKSGDFINLTYLGEVYLNKPPLFYWFTVVSSKIFGWDAVTIRALSIFFVVLTALLIYFFSKYLFKDEKAGFFGAVAYLSFFDVLFWYGWIGEIDATFTFFVFFMFVLQFIGFRENKGIFIVLSGVVAGLSFLLKGIPSYLFFGTNFLVMAVFYKKFFVLFRPIFLLSYVFALLVPAVWIFSTSQPITLLKTLLYEGTQRVKKDSHALIKHILGYPLTNIKQTLPASVFFIYMAIRKKIPLNKDVKLLFFIIGINYLPYLFSVGSHGRYVLPLFPIFAVVFGYALSRNSKTLQKAFFVAVAFFIVLRLFAGVFLVPYIMKKDGNIKSIALDMAKIIDNGNIVCNCEGSHKSVCFFVEVYEDKILKLPHLERDWDYLIDCNNLDSGKLIKSYKYRKGIIKLYKRSKDEN